MSIKFDPQSEKPVIVNGRVFWRVGGKLLPAVAGAASDPPKDPKDDEPTEDEKKLDEKITHIVRAQLDRAMKKATGDFSKTIADTVSQSVAKAMEGIKPPAPTEDDGKGGKAKEGAKADPEFLKMKERLEKVEKENADRAAKLAAAEERQRKNDARTALKSALDAKGVKGRRADAAIALMEDEGMLGFTEDGAPVLTVKRSRSKGAAAEALEFDDIGAGIDDWTKTADAAEFLPAPGGSDAKNGGGSGARSQQRQASGNAGGSNNDARRAPPRYSDTAADEKEMVRRTAEQLERAGIDLNNLSD